MKKELELYLHIPFCKTKCAYCDFLSGPGRAEEIEAYVEALVLEIGYYHTCKNRYCVTSIFVGGGTPSILMPVQIGEIFRKLDQVFDIAADAEITIEANPGTVEPEDLISYRRIGINRISLGLQSTQEEELRLLGRSHSYKTFLNSYEGVRNAGFQNVNIDLMFALPGQTIENFLESAERVTQLEPEHIAVYSLILEEGTPFFKQYAEGNKRHTLPDEETERLMYWSGDQLLHACGYERYEISNYARKGYECRHNLGYWEGKEYLGIGAGAASLFENRRFTHIRDRDTYTHSLIDGNLRELSKKDEEIFMRSKEAQMEEFWFLGLRRTNGVSANLFEENFGVSVQSVYGEEIGFLRWQNLLEEKGDSIFLTNRGIDLCNYVCSRFLL